MDSEDPLDVYRNCLRHVVRPSDPSERDSCDRVLFTDWLALWTVERFRAYAAYESPSETHENVALAYAQYAEYCVRVEDADAVFFYAHTATARAVLHDVFDPADGCVYERAADNVATDIPEP